VNSCSEYTDSIEKYKLECALRKITFYFLFFALKGQRSFRFPILSSKVPAPFSTYINKIIIRALQVNFDDIIYLKNK
jgi:hypothetical protein